MVLFRNMRSFSIEELMRAVPRGLQDLTHYVETGAESEARRRLVLENVDKYYVNRVRQNTCAFVVEWTPKTAYLFEEKMRGRSNCVHISVGIIVLYANRMDFVSADEDMDLVVRRIVRMWNMYEFASKKLETPDEDADTLVCVRSRMCKLTNSTSVQVKLEPGCPLASVHHALSVMSTAHVFEFKRSDSPVAFDFLHAYTENKVPDAAASRLLWSGETYFVLDANSGQTVV
jgi:hypothetical protein